MLQQLQRRYPHVRHILQRSPQNIDAVIAQTRHQTVQSGCLALRKVVRHAGVPEFAIHLLAGHTDDVVNLVQLVELVFAGKQRIQRENLVEDTTNGPDVDFRVVVAGGEQRFRRPIPTCRDVGGVRRRFGGSSGRSEVGQLDDFCLKQNQLYIYDRYRSRTIIYI